MDLDDAYELIILNYDLEDLYAKGWRLDDLEDGLQPFLEKNMEEVENFLREDGWLD